MDDILKMYEGKEVFGCQFFLTRLNLNPETFSLCHEAQVGDRILGRIEDLSPKTYYGSLRRLIEENKDSEAPCHFCSKGRKYRYQFVPIQYVTVCTSSYCNSSCIYCSSHLGEKDSGYDPIKYLKDFYVSGLLARDCFFDWGGGEPTLNPYFEKTVDWIDINGYRQRINTNAILFSKTAYKALVGHRASIRISIDSGTRECFEVMKGHKDYDKVWDNVARYCAAGDRVYIKYNVCNYNSEKERLNGL